MICSSADFFMLANATSVSSVRGDNGGDASTTREVASDGGAVDSWRSVFFRDLFFGAISN